MRTPSDKRDQSRYCQYHASVGHHTDQCISLKHFLESLVKKNLMGDYLQHPRIEPAVPAPQLALGAPPRHIVNMIAGGDFPMGSLVQVLHVDRAAPAFRFPNIPITFSDEDFPPGDECCSGPLTVQLDISGQDVKKVLIDNGSSADIIFRHTLRRMIPESRIEERNAQDLRGPLYGFGNNAVPIQGVIELPTTFGTYPREITAFVRYYIIDIASSYNVIIGRPTLFYLGAIISTPHMKVKFPTGEGPGELVSDRWASRSCYSASISLAQTHPKKRKNYGEPKRDPGLRNSLKDARTDTDKILMIDGFPKNLFETEDQGRWGRMIKAAPGEPTEAIPLLSEDSSKVILVGSLLEEPLKSKLVELLKNYHDVFAWGPEDMPGLDEEVALHHLHIRPDCKPVIQKRRNLGPKDKKLSNPRSVSF